MNSAMLMKDAFLSTIDYICKHHINPEGQLIVRGPDNEMISVDREEFMVDDNGVEIGNEFVIGWDGIKLMSFDDGILLIILKDGKTIDIEGGVTGK